MSARAQKSKRRQPIPFEASPIPLPAPVTAPCPKTVRFRGVASRWGSIKAYIKKTVAAPSLPSSSSSLVEVSAVDPAQPQETAQFNENDEVDEVVVDRSWSEDFETETNSDGAETASSRHGATVTEAGTLDARPEGLWAIPPLLFIRCRLWPFVKEFYKPSFGQPEEQLYQKEVWGQTKRLSLWASVFFIASGLAAIVSIQDPIVLADKART
jgi:osomolarity two-component system sensor histidine kinase SLN1